MVLAIQKMGCRSSRRSRSVPPPIAVTTTITATPRISRPLRPAASTPLTAKTCHAKQLEQVAGQHAGYFMTWKVPRTRCHSFALDTKPTIC